jgi:ribosomal protein S14
MVGKCANPECSAPFRYLHEGKLFQVDMRELPGGRGAICDLCGRASHVRHFWLCDACARTMTVICTTEGSVQVVRRSVLAVAAVSLACPQERIA